MMRHRTCVTLALISAIITTGCRSTVERAEKVERKTSPAAVSLVVTTTSLGSSLTAATVSNS